jgi:hypothetical protein
LSFFLSSLGGGLVAGGAVAGGIDGCGGVVAGAVAVGRGGINVARGDVAVGGNVVVVGGGRVVVGGTVAVDVGGKVVAGGNVAVGGCRTPGGTTRVAVVAVSDVSPNNVVISRVPADAELAEASPVDGSSSDKTHQATAPAPNTSKNIAPRAPKIKARSGPLFL